MTHLRAGERQPLHHAAALLGVTLVTAGCALLRSPVSESTAPPPSAAPEAARADVVALRDWARGLAREHCGACHIGSRPTAKPAALAIYNLDDSNWSATLSPERLRAGFTRRLNGRLDDAGQQRLREFVEAEIVSRGK